MEDWRCPIAPGCSRATRATRAAKAASAARSAKSPAGGKDLSSGAMSGVGPDGAAVGADVGGGAAEGVEAA